MNQTISKPISFKEGDGFIHGFSTGKVKVKSEFRTAKGNVLTSKIRFLFDTEFTEFMPIMVWVVDHPEGVFVIDTGENADVTSDGYFKEEGFLLNAMNKQSFIFDVDPEDEAGPQLQKLGYQESDIDRVILTHLHLDHFDGLRYFEETDIIINQLEWEKPSSALPSLYPQWFEPTTVQFSNSIVPYFRHSLPLVESNELLLVHTPGHTLGHCSLLIKSREIDYLLAGDVTYNQLQLEHDINAGGHQSFKQSQLTYRAIKHYASDHRLVYLPSHDAEVFDRLRNDILLKP